MKPKETKIIQSSPIAIIGMGCFFPKSSGLKEYWRLLFHGEDAISDIPETHWLTKDYYDEDPKKPDHIYCTRGGFLNPVSFDPTEFGIPPSSLEATDTSQLLGLVAAKAALKDSGYEDGKPFNRDRTSVILGVTGTQELVIPLGARLGHPVWRKALESSGIAPEKTREIIQKISDSYVSWQENSFPGLLGNVVAGRICNRLDLGGTNCVVDAACASSLSAVHLAIMELWSGRSDMVITGGVDTLNDIFMHMCFSKTFVLSSTGDVRPFSKDADGTVLGEGIGIFVLKRLEDAENDGDKIYAVIKALGSSSDGKSQSIYAPRASGQAKALQMAYNHAGIDAATVELVEAHGTGTRVGDVVEFQALTQLFDRPHKNGNFCAIGSVKSNIGHTKAAAGAAGLMKTALALYHKVLPPTLKAEEPDPKLKIHESPFYLNTESRPWFSRKEHPRRAGISAFGFGGSNFHAVLEEYQQDKPDVSWDGSVEIVALSAPTHKQLMERLRSLKVTLDNSGSYKQIAFHAANTRGDFSASDPCRLLIVLEQSLDQFKDPLGTVNRAITALESNKTLNAWQLKNIFYGGPEKPGKIAFLFPGQGSQYVGMGRDLACSFPDAFNVLEKANKKYKAIGRITDFIYPHPAQTVKEQENQQVALTKTDIAQPALGAISISMMKVLHWFGITPDATCGHSFGELSALCAAGWIDLDTLLHLSITRGRLMAAVGQNENQNKGAMLAVKAPLDEIADLIKTTGTEVLLANRNSPEQGVLSGSTAAIAQIEKLFGNKGIRTVRLPVSAAFHSSLVKDAQEPFIKTLKNIRVSPSDIQVFSNTTGSPYPADPGKIKKLLGEHLLSPVDFVGDIENLFQTGVKTFVEVGPKSVLTGLVKSTLKDRNIQAIALDDSAGRRSGMSDLACALCHLGSLGYAVNLNKWEQTAHGIRKQKMSIPIAGANYRSRETHAIKQETGIHKKQLEHSSNNRAGSVNPPGPRSSSMLENKNTEAGESGRQISGDSLANPIDPNQDTMNKNHKQSDFIINALQVVQEGLKSMQALQRQTAETHQKFLETQTEAGRTLQQMMEHTKRLAETSLAPQTAPELSDFRHENFQAKIPDSEDAITGLQKTAEGTPATEHQSTSKMPSKAMVSPVLSEPAGKKVSIEAPEIKPVHPAFASSNNSLKGLEARMLDVVSELTGYPVETLAMDMDIEADLGIDSIKRVEILSTLEEKIPGLPTVSPEIMGSMKTLGQIAEYLSGAKNIDNTQSPSEVDSPDLSDDYNPDFQGSPDYFPKETFAGAPKHSTGMVDRKIVSLVDKPSNFRGRLSLSGDRTVFITDDHAGLSEAISREFASLNIHTVLVSHEVLQDFLQGNRFFENAGGLVILPDNRPNRQAGWNPQDIKFLKDAFLLTQRLAPDLIEAAGKGGAFFATITRLDGAFGFKGRGMKSPLQGGLAGLAKTAAIEWETVCCHAIDIAPEWKENEAIAKAVVAELMNPDASGPIEIGLDSNARRILELESSPYPQGDVNINPGDVVVITGGARGITASVSHALARRIKPTLILLGRSPLPAPEPEWLVSIENEAAIKKAILENEFNRNNVTPKQIEKSFKTHMVNREIMKNLETMKQCGATVLYYPVDIRDDAAVQAILDDVRSEHGPITAIVHGAGILEDRLIIDKTIDQFENVFDTKVKGLHVLLEATKSDALKYIVLFSSITARIGNNGQVDYAMANEVLNKVAQQESATRSNCKVLSINWGPWDGGMVCSALKRKFEQNGVELIPTDAGAACMIHELAGDNGFPVEVVIGAKIAGEKDRSGAKTVSCAQDRLSLTLQSEVDMDSYPILGAHILGGKPVVPLSLIAEWLGHGALHENPGLFFHGLDDMRVFRGIKISRDKKIIRLLAGKPRKKGAIFEIDVEIRDGNQNDARMTHSRATAILTDTLGKPPSFEIPDHIGTNAYLKSMDEVYERILFHGMELRGIQEITGYSSHGMVARISSAPLPEKWITNPIRSKWISDPLVIDSAFQMAIIWCFEQRNVVSLPSYCASYRQYRNDFPSDGVTAVLEVKELTNHKLMGNFTFLDAHGVVVAQLTGYEAVMDAALSKAFKPQHAA